MRGGPFGSAAHVVRGSYSSHVFVIIPVVRFSYLCITFDDFAKWPQCASCLLQHKSRGGNNTNKYNQIVICVCLFLHKEPLSRSVMEESSCKRCMPYCKTASLQAGSRQRHGSAVVARGQREGSVRPDRGQHEIVRGQHDV